MIKIFDEGQGRETAGAVARGGVLVSVEERSGLQGLIGLCVSQWDGPRGRYLASERGYQDAMRGLYADLMVGGILLSEHVAGDTGERPWQKRIEEIARRGSRNRYESLLLALATCFDAWDPRATEKESPPRASSQLLLAIADPARQGDGEIEVAFATPTAALVMQPGSLLASFVVEGGIKGYGWLITVVAKGARLVRRTAQAAGNRLVEGAREQAGKRAKYPDLPRLDRLSPADSDALRERQVVLVFLHGLFGTDLATFDGFIERLHATNPLALGSKLRQEVMDGTRDPANVPGGRPDALGALLKKLAERLDAFSKAEPEKAERLAKLTPARASDGVRSAVDSAIGLVGWPHNTLTAISTNAGELADALERAFPPDPPGGPPRDTPKILFVCHSRGGLVARATAAILLEIESRREAWGKALLGLITFGTPHDGASIAEHPLRDLATYFLLLQSTRKVASLTDVLAYLDARTPEGIEQLKRYEATTVDRAEAFVEGLYSRERGLKGPSGRRQPPAMAVGARLDEEARATWRGRAASALVTRWLDTPDHDLVVELSSSISARLDAEITAVMACDHFSYFDQRGAASDLAANLALARVWSEVDLAKAFRDVGDGSIHAPGKAEFRFKLRGQDPPKPK